MNTESQLAAELVQRFKDLAVIDLGRGDVMHAGLCDGAFNDYFDPNTGGHVWLSHSLHRVGGQVLLVTAGCDSLGVYRSPHATSAEAASEALYELCGEDSHLRVAEGGYDFPDNWSQRPAAMAAILARFRERKGLPELAPEQLLGKSTDAATRQWLESYLQQREELCGSASVDAPLDPAWIALPADAMDEHIEKARARVDRLGTALRRLMDYVGGWDEKADHPCGIGRDALEEYEAAKSIAMPEILIETTDKYGMAFKDAVESFILAGADPGMVQTVLDAFDNNAPDPVDARADPAPVFSGRSSGLTHDEAGWELQNKCSSAGQNFVIVSPGALWMNADDREMRGVTIASGIVHRDHAERIMACVQACRGIPQEALVAGDLIVALQQAASAIRDLNNGWPLKELAEPVEETLARFDRLGVGVESPSSDDELETEGMKP